MVPVGPKRGDYRERPLPDAAAATGEEGLEAADPADPDLDAPVDRRRAVVEATLHGQRLDKGLVQMAPEFSRSHLQHLIEQGHVHIDGAAAGTASRRLKAGQLIDLVLVPTEESRAFKPQPMELAVLFEDEHLLVLDKPAGLVVHPAPGNWSGTLLNGLLAHHAAAATLPRAGIVHRLDKDTSGVMMVGKTLPAVTALVRAIAARQVHRRYLAIAHVPKTGLPAGRFSIDAPIGRDPVMRVRMAVVTGGRASRTDVECLAQHDRLAALSCTLHSGRTHQIRVHLAWRGLPLVADTLYGGKAALSMQRQALHATELRLAHPISGRELQFDCPPPADFQQAWQQLMPG
ncbi:MAG: RluA family pseudouridine synthase [Rubrivivax sp.]|nr:RluA family pseudouridine synthase [Rubrivivax sp.]MDP3614291.1 RluA family pseudouridine synthase [Rubrivivax sp.]